MFDLSWDEERALYTVTGAIVINWGIIESCLSQACHLLMALGGERDHDKSPKEFTRRLNFTKEAFNKDARLTHMRDFARSLRGDTRELVKHRDFIVHGTITGYARDTQTFQFTRLDTEEKAYVQNSTDLTVLRLLEIADVAQKVGTDWIKIVEGLHSVRDANESK